MKIKVSTKLLNCFLFAMAAGIVLTEHFGLTLKFLSGICAAAAAAIFFISTVRKNFPVIPAAFCVIFFAFGSFRFFAAENLPTNDISRFEGQTVGIVGEISEEPQIKILPNEMKQIRYVVETNFVKIRGENISASGKIILTEYHGTEEENFPVGEIGDKISANGNLKFITNYKNPGQIDTVTRMKADGITARMSAGKNGAEIEKNEGSLKIKFLRLVSKIREHYRETMSEVMSREDAAAVFAMLFGGYAGINPEVVEDFQTTGIVHILSVSGSHMSLIAAATAYLCLLLKFPRPLTVTAGIFVIFTYTLLSGILPQVVRSASMGVFIFIATALKVETVGARLLTLAATAMLIFQPLLIFDISFQLSFSSTAGLMYLSEDLRLKMHRLPTWIKFPAAMTLSAQLASLPIIIWYFNQVSLSSVLANVLVMPILELVIVGGLFGGFVALIIPLLGKIFFVAESLIFSAGTEINRILANLPFSSVQVPSLGISAGIIYYVGLITRRTEIFLLIILILSANFFRQGGELEVNFVDVGQGDCAVVLTPHGKCLIFDTGGVREKRFDVGGRVLVPFLKHENVREVEKIFLTHVHEDHSGGAGSIIKKMPVREIITAGESKAEYAAVFGIAEEKIENIRVGNDGEIFNIDGVEVEIVYAPKVGTGNEISNVYRIRYGDITFLITGDLVKEIESDMLAKKIDVKSTVLKVGHHGSATSSGEEFLQAVNPVCAVISVGYGNSFGHPRSEVLERLKKVGAKIYRTDKDGLIKFKTDGKKISVSKFS